MPIEIRELTIKTEIRTTMSDATVTKSISEEDFTVLKLQLLDSCKRMISDVNRRTKYNR
ncbi:DUF5908 family protein [Dokdonia sp.]|uniref:DUF5908 family protein n=1 Tax=Dokdonia sp. TaxID=2024995 RepID=UPI003263926A